MEILKWKIGRGVPCTIFQGFSFLFLSFSFLSTSFLCERETELTEVTKRIKREGVRSLVPVCVSVCVYVCTQIIQRSF